MQNNTRPVPRQPPQDRLDRLHVIAEAGTLGAATPFWLSMTSPSQQPADPLVLTPLQQDILVLLMNGMDNREIADRLGITPGKVGMQVGRIVQKLGLTHRAEIVNRRRPEQSWGRDGGDLH
jgi:DNA-binding CsgD family transcriptional regulator